MISARTQGKNRCNIEDRIKKIEEETTGCLASIQDVLLQITKNDKSINDKLYHVESKLRKELLEVGRKVQGVDGLEGRLGELEGRVGEIEQREGEEGLDEVVR